ncbi:hypothetical protein GCM10010123_17710 [Pilimelia anulata]|uniref:PASTA domain-containing protein n=1 Tax=Pilimelia anulata TaxID=53371 RepID=A0A8J3B6M7_9ACTN|nr:PASTA domain-containing protein [Pilimelia anulata]GGJ88560.1 hypothetical protein GCM10010123_17710 [Pilimelia anulata]
MAGDEPGQRGRWPDDGSPGGDHTAPMPPAGPPGGEPGHTAPIHPAGEPGRPGQAAPPADATTRMPAVGGTDATAAMPGRPAPPDATSVMPGVPGGPGQWSARAEVPQYVPAAEPDPGWGAPAGEPKRWWLPVLLGLVAVLLLGSLGYGLWLAFGDDDEPAAPTPTASATSARPRPTTAAPTRTVPRPTRTTVAPELVEVPDVVGGSRADAQRRLDAAGLNYRLRYRVTDEADPDTVLATDPGPGEEVDPNDTVVTLTIAEEPAETDPPETEEPTPQLT